jgi:DNA-binding response OmpR family regulator
MTAATPAVDLQVRLADEGVPLRAIARATRIPSETVRDLLHQAREDGRLVELPREDWPPGFPRDQRALQLSRMVHENRDALFLAVQQVFNLTHTEVSLLMALIQSPSVLKARQDMSNKTVEVHLCSLRKQLQPFAISISTLWGYGYQLTRENKHKVMDLILRKVAA